MQQTKRIKKNWARYNRSDGIVEIIVRDETGAKQDVFKANHKDHKNQGKISAILLQKWNIRLIPDGYNSATEEGFFEW